MKMAVLVSVHIGLLLLVAMPASASAELAEAKPFMIKIESCRRNEI